MFERYTEKARRTIFFARYEASQFGSPLVEPEHLMLGVFREDKALALQFLGSHSKLEALRCSIAQHGKTGPEIATSVDLPLSQGCKRVLTYAADESDRMHHKHIGTEHLLVGLLREEESLAAHLLREQGLTLESVRQQVQQSEMSPAGRSSFFARLDAWLAESESRGGIWSVKEKHVGTRSTKFSIYAKREEQIPVLCIEIIRDERFSDVQTCCDQHLAGGIPQVWLLDPETRRAYTVTSAEGLREFKGEILQSEHPPLEMDLRKIFD